MKILKYFAQRRINKALMKALATEVTAKLDDREFNLNSDTIGRLSTTMGNDAYAEALSNGMKRRDKSDNNGRNVSNFDMHTKLASFGTAPEMPERYVEFDDGLSSRLNNSLTIMAGNLSPNNGMFIINSEDALYIISLLEEVKKGLED